MTTQKDVAYMLLQIAYTKAEKYERSERAMINVAKNEYNALRAFSLEIRLFDFKELEAMESEINDKLDAEHIKASKMTAEAAIKMLQNGIDTKEPSIIIDAYNMIEEDSSFKWDDIDSHYFDEWNELVDLGNDIIL